MVSRMVTCTNDVASALSNITFIIFAVFGV